MQSDTEELTEWLLRASASRWQGGRDRQCQECSGTATRGHPGHRADIERGLSDDIGRCACGVDRNARAARLFDQFYARFVAMRACQLRVASNQRRIESFCKDHVGRIVRRNGVAQSPNSQQQVRMPGAFDIQCNVVFECLPAASRADLFEIREATKCLRDLDINQVGSVETLAGVQHTLLHLDAFIRTEQKLEFG
jgi:hypothetical protein